MIIVVALPVWLVELENRGIYIILLSWLVYYSGIQHTMPINLTLGSVLDVIVVYNVTCTYVLPYFRGTFPVQIMSSHLENQCIITLSSSLANALVLA